jgi:hypothetical protein
MRGHYHYSGNRRLAPGTLCPHIGDEAFPNAMNENLLSRNVQLRLIWTNCRYSVPAKMPSSPKKIRKKKRLCKTSPTPGHLPSGRFHSGRSPDNKSDFLHSPHLEKTHATIDSLCNQKSWPPQNSTLGKMIMPFRLQFFARNAIKTCKFMKQSLPPPPSPTQ